MTLDDYNYYNDRRVRAGEHNDGIKALDERNMLATLNLGEDEDGVTEIHFIWTVCPTCDGKGSHVNPSIDCNGLSREDFDDDPDFRENYLSGLHDVPCYECKGRRVTPELSPQGEREQAAHAEYIKRQEDEAYYESISRTERMMGA